jgi:phytoene desaturase
MNYADLELGTWYPKGGMHKIVEGMVSLAEEKGVEFHYNSPVENLVLNKKSVKGVQVRGQQIDSKAVIAGADYHHVDKNLLPESKRMYSEKYWDSRVLAPSSLLFYLGVNKKLTNLKHHNLFFDTDFTKHSEEIYDQPQWPSDPLFYVCVPSITDDSVAPTGCENLFVLMPIAPDLSDNEEMRERYYNILLSRLEEITGEKIKDNVIYKRSYCVDDFKSDYNSYKGNAYGLANTLTQTAFLKPKLQNKYLPNLFYTGQLTTPGPGVPPSIISGQVVADFMLNKKL